MSSIMLRHVDFETAEANPDLTVNLVNRETPLITVFSLIDDPDNNLVFQGTNSFTSLLATLAITSMIVSGFLVVNIINTVIVEQKKQIGVMKSFGATAWGNVVMYGGIALSYGIIGTIPGILFGILTGHIMSKALEPLAEVILPDFSVSTVGNCDCYRARFTCPVIRCYRPCI